MDIDRDQRYSQLDLLIQVLGLLISLVPEERVGSAFFFLYKQPISYCGITFRKSYELRATLRQAFDHGNTLLRQFHL